ncbi:MAG: hypothetical protein LBT83_09365 [Tannerella sp.]|jgi:hypothetical protein|nr:hypothetical protein [Tannerella sp.]
MATKQKTSASKTKQPDTTGNGEHARYINPHIDFGFNYMNTIYSAEKKVAREKDAVIQEKKLLFRKLKLQRYLSTGLTKSSNYCNPFLFQFFYK